MRYLVIKAYQKWFLCYHLPCSFKTFIKVFAFTYAKAKSKEIWKEMSLHSSSFTKMLMSALLLIFIARLIISKKCVYSPIILCGFQ